MLSNAAQGKGQGVAPGGLGGNQALHLNRRSPSLVTKPPLAPAGQPQPSQQRSSLAKPSFQVCINLSLFLDLDRQVIGKAMDATLDEFWLRS